MTTPPSAPDLVARLRNCREGSWTPLINEAAAEIERLRAEVGGMAKAIDAADIDNERLRAVLRTWSENSGRLQTIEDRERFRQQAREALRGAGEKT